MWWLKGAIPTTSQISRHDPGRRRGALEFPAHLEHEAFTTGPVARVCRERPKSAAGMQSGALSLLQAESPRDRELAVAGHDVVRSEERRVGKERRCRLRVWACM